MTSHLYPTTCENAACGRFLASGDGVLVITGRWAFRYCHSACGDEGYRIHNAVTPLMGPISAATDAARASIAALLHRRLPDGIEAEIDWTATGTIDLGRCSDGQ